MFRDPCLLYHIIMLKINLKGMLTLVFWFINVKYLLIRINEKTSRQFFKKIYPEGCPRRSTCDPLSAVIPWGVFGLATQRHLMYY